MAGRRVTLKHVVTQASVFWIRVDEHDRLTEVIHREARTPFDPTVRPPLFRRGDKPKHRARWYTPWRLLLGELAYQAGHRGVSHFKTPQEGIR